MLDWIDKYKYGIIATMTAYMIIFMYLQMESYTQYYPITPFHEGARLEKEKEIELQQEQIEVNPEYAEQLKNMAQDLNDQREKSYENYSPNKNLKQVEQSVKDYEKKLFEEAGGEKERERIRQQMAQMEKEREQNKDAKKDTKENSKQGSDKAYKGDVMVDYVLSGRNPHLNNFYYIRNPGYTCGFGARGVVTVRIKVNKNGDVTAANYDSSQSSGANSCMIEQAVKYAKMSRFAYGDAAPAIQEGYIIYKFVAQ